MNIIVNIHLVAHMLYDYGMLNEMTEEMPVAKGTVW